MADIHIHAPLCLAAGAIFPPVCAALVAARFWARRRQGVKLGWDDWLSLPALILQIGMCITIIIGSADKAIGYPIDPIPPGETKLTAHRPKQQEVRATIWAIELMQIPCLTCIKLSFTLFYLRIFGKGSGKTFRYTLNSLMVLIVLWGIAFFLPFLFVCRTHFSAYWTSLADTKKYCFNTVPFVDAFGVTDVFIDLIIILLPIPMVLRLNMVTLQKFAVLGVFGLGAFSVVASILRMVVFVESSSKEFIPSVDFDLLITGGTYWSVVESGVALIAVCLPTVFNVFKDHVKKRFTTTQTPSRSWGYIRHNDLDDRALQGKQPSALYNTPLSDVELASLRT